MSTISELFKLVSNDIQGVFEELIKLTLMKSLKPTLNPYIQNAKSIYNAATGKYERAYVGASPDINVNRYSYNLTNECLGWTDENISAFKINAKIIKSSFPNRKPQNAGSYNSKLSKVSVAYNNRAQKSATKNYNSLTQLLTAQNAQNLISNQKSGAYFICNISYIDSFRSLESIGIDIINQTDPAVSAVISSQLSTSMLRAKLFNLDTHLSLLNTNYPDIYAAYIQLILAINSIQQTNMVFIINLVAILSCQPWSEFSDNDQALYLETLGEDFITEFTSNLLVNVLLQTENESLIFTGSYLFALLKMLFIVFGFGKLTPTIVNTASTSRETMRLEQLAKHYDKYRGSGFRRGDSRETAYSVQEYSINSVETSVVDNTYIIEFINQFNVLYPNIITIMGGVSNLPQTSVTITSADIPADFVSLTTIQEYLWRYSYYSYATYVNYISMKQIINANDLKIKINNKKIELRNL